MMASTTQPPVTALRYYGREDLRLDKVPARICGRDEVRVEIAYCGICGSDIHEYLGGPIFAPKPGEKNKWTGEQLPITLGHEMSGIITELGTDVRNLTVGSKVAVNPALDDRHYGYEPCATCNLGKINICRRFSSYGFSAPGGGFASEIVVKAISCIALPESVSLKVGALLEPLAVAWHTIRTSGFQPGQTALVLGAGPIGLAILMLLRVWNVRSVVISEITPSRQEMAKNFGADFVVDPLHPTQNGDPVLATIHQEIGEDGVDVAFDATGLQATLDTAITATRPGGTIFNIAIHEKPLQIALNDLTCFEKRLTGGMCYNQEDFEGVWQALASGKAPAHDMITSVVPLKYVIDGGFLELIRNKASHVKILVQPSPPPSELRLSKL